MKSAIILTTLAVIGVQAQSGAPKSDTAPSSDPKSAPPKAGAAPSSDPKSATPKAPSGDAKSGDASFLSIMGSLAGTFGNGVPFGPAPKGCAKYEVIIARGTFEPGPFGVIVGDGLMRQLEKDMAGEGVRGYAVQYPASITGSDVGINDVANRVINKSKECPDMKFAIVGYSQGGMVASAGAAKIPKDIRDSKVVALVLYGAGDGAGGGSPMGRGSAPAADIKAKTLANCAPGDMCGKRTADSPGMAGHLTYGNLDTMWHARSSQYIKNAFHGQAQGYKLDLEPK